ncbi:MAG TPA: amine oxidase [Saprospirales bacterium]|nr:amine oxidase [Saprospirales bacterium]
MKRRNFIKTAGLVALSPSLLASCHPDDANFKDKSVIVIGAGIAGLAAARKLKDNGFQVTVLEAQDRVGGRLRSNRSPGIAFDEGASWIHGINGNPIANLAQQAGMETFHTNDESIVSYDLGGVKRSDSAYANAEEAFYNILETLKNQGSANKSFETVFFEQYPQYANDRLYRFFLSSFVTFDLGDLDQLSSLLYDEGEEFSGIEKIAVNGYDTIPAYLAQGLDVQLLQKVTQIEYAGAKVLVTHNFTASEADYVIVTVPLGVLKKNIITFLPALPVAKQTAIEKVGMNCVNKFLLTWDAPFWDDKQYIVYTPEAKDKFNYFVNIKKIHPATNALMTFAYADYGRQTESMTDAQVVQEIMAHIRDMYGVGIPDPTQLFRTKWATNEYTFGGYSFTALNTEMRHFDDLAAELNNKLFFAGEHTEIDYFSTAHGAYLSGIREADKIIDLQ